MALVYSDVVSELAYHWQPGNGGSADPDFVARLPGIIDRAERRCYRDVDFQVARKSENSSFQGSAPGRALVAPPTDLIVIRQFDYFTPAGQDDSSGGTRMPLYQRDESFLKLAYPTRTITAPPRYWCFLGTQSNPAPATPGALNILVCPTPDDVYQIQMAGTFRPDAMSSTTTATWLGNNYPDFFLYALMVELAGAMKNYGTMADDSPQGITWEGRYKQALDSALRQEAQRRSAVWVDRAPLAPSAPPQGSPQA
jgi:hypothetical protein